MCFYRVLSAPTNVCERALFEWIIKNEFLNTCVYSGVLCCVFFCASIVQIQVFFLFIHCRARLIFLSHGWICRVFYPLAVCVRLCCDFTRANFETSCKCFGIKIDNFECEKFLYVEYVTTDTLPWPCLN